MIGFKVLVLLIVFNILVLVLISLPDTREF